VRYQIFYITNAPKCVWWIRWGSLLWELPTDPLAELRGRERGREGKGKGGIRDGKEGKGRTPHPMFEVR